jgi:hypothetical protein
MTLGENSNELPCLDVGVPCDVLCAVIVSMGASYSSVILDLYTTLGSIANNLLCPIK